MEGRVIEVLKSIRDNFDYQNCETIMDDHVLSSLDLMQLITSLEDEFEILIPAEDINFENFNSVNSIVNMIKRLV